jgi:hypothetical protein
VTEPSPVRSRPLRYETKAHNRREKPKASVDVTDTVCAKERVLKMEESSIAAASELRYKLKIINSEPDQ